jgi:hypothetical protein
MFRSRAAFSAGNPKESHPIGCSTSFPLILLTLAWNDQGYIS